MSYINDNLKQGEEIVHKADLHWGMFVLPVIILIIAAIIPSGESTIVLFIRIAILIFGIYKLIERIFLKIGSEYVVTNKRVIFKEGVLKQEATELALTKCENLAISQSFFGRLLNFGSISVATAGSRTNFNFIANPKKFMNTINNQI